MLSGAGYSQSVFQPEDLLAQNERALRRAGEAFEITQFLILVGEIAYHAGFVEHAIEFAEQAGCFAGFP